MIIIIILSFLYFISRAYTEAHKWGSPLSSSVYHVWRFVESLFIFIVLLRLFGLKGAGFFFVGLFLYERILCYRLNKKWFKDEGDIFQLIWDIPRHKWQDLLILITGIILVIL